MQRSWPHHFSSRLESGDPVEKPVRTVVQNPVEALLTRGSHADPRVNEFVHKYLRPLSQAVNDRIDFRRDLVVQRENEIYPRKNYPEGSYAYNPKLIKEELSILNAEMVSVMINGKTTKPDYERQWAVFAQYLGCTHVMTHKDVPNSRSWDAMMHLKFIEYSLDTNENLPRDAILDIMAQLKAPLYYATQFDPDGEEGFPFMLTYFYSTFEVTHDIHDLIRVARPIYNAERKRMEDYFNCYEGAMDGLQNSPILADSGRYEQTEGPRQSFADRANEVANELTHLGKGHAKVKLPTGEYLLETIVPKTNRKHLEERKERIIQNTTKNYCRKVDEIEEEIRKRQDQDGGDGPPTSTTRKHPV